LGAGELEYVAGVGPGSVSGTLAGIPSRAVWIVSNRILHSIVAQPEVKTLEQLRGKKIGVTGLGGTTHTSLMIAIEKSGGNPKEFIVVALGPQQYLRALEAKSVDAATIDPPLLFLVVKRGFNRLLDLGSVVEMPVGGLTTLTQTLTTKPDQVRKVIRALQEAKQMLLHSKERAVDFTMRIMKMDRETALEVTRSWPAPGKAPAFQPAAASKTSSAVSSRKDGSPTRKRLSRTSPIRASPCRLRGSSARKQSKKKCWSAG
jgi:ABC-type nitrate/sulfonate/bicarbonate transport system substrate-binding protein